MIQQELRDWELLIINDGGCDLSGIVAGFSDERIIYHNRLKNLGKAACCNYGLAKARGRYIAYIDDDDKWYPQHLKVLERTLDDNPDVGLAYSDLYEVSFHENIRTCRRVVLGKRLKHSWRFDRDVLLSGLKNTMHVSMMHRRDLARKAGGYDETIRVMIDQNISRKLAFYTNFIHVSEITGEYWADPTQGARISEKEREDQKDFLDTLRRIRADIPPKPWTKVESVSVILPIMSWDEVTRKTALNILDTIYYPFEFILVDVSGEQDHQKPPDLWADLLTLKNVTPLTGSKDGGKIGAYALAARNSQAEYLYLADAGYDQNIKGRVILFLNYCRNKKFTSFDALMTRSPQESAGQFNVFLKKDTFLEKYPSGLASGLSIEIIPEGFEHKAFTVNNKLYEIERQFSLQNYGQVSRLLDLLETHNRQPGRFEATQTETFPYYLRLEQYEKLQRACMTLIGRGEDGDCRINLGVALYHQKQYQEALKAFSQGLRDYSFNPLDLDGLELPVALAEAPMLKGILGIGDCLVELGAYAEAVDKYRVVARMYPHGHRHLLGMARIFMRNKELDLAEQHLVAAAKIGHRDPETFRLLGGLCELKGQNEGAFTFYENAFSLGAYSRLNIEPLFRVGSGLEKWPELKRIFEELQARHPLDRNVAGKLAAIDRKLDLTANSPRKAEQPRIGRASAGQVATTVQRDEPKIARNAQCPCGSGKKYKKCCLGKPIPDREAPSIQVVPNDTKMSREEKIERLKSLEKVRIRVVSAADKVEMEGERARWGDYWVKRELEDEFEKMGLEVNAETPDVIVHLFGEAPDYLPEHTYNVVWLHSHPDMVNAENLKPFDRIFCLSARFVPKLEAMGYDNIEVMPAATSKQPQSLPQIYDVVFAGNARGRKGRSIVNALGHPAYNLKVWGAGWNLLLPPIYFGGESYPYPQVERLYASSKICLNDHHPDMAREGFTTFRLFDICASGGFAISDPCLGLDDLFKGAVPQYDSDEHLRELIEYYLNNVDELNNLRGIGQEIALKHTFDRRARQLVREFICEESIEEMALSVGRQVSLCREEITFG